MMINAAIILLALAMSLTFFGKSIIGISMGIATLVSFFVIFKNRQEIFVKGKIKGFFYSKELMLTFLMVGAWAMSSVFGINPTESLDKTLKILGMIIGGVCIFIAIKSSNNNHYELFSRTLIIAAGICSLLMVISPFVGSLGIEWSSSYGSVLAIIFPFAFIYAITSKKYVSILWICLFLVTAGVFSSGGRTAWVGFIFSFILCVSFMPWSVISKKIKVMSIILVLIASVFGVFVKYNSQTGDVFIARVNAMKTMDRPASGRLEIWGNTIDLIEQRPLLGYGIKSTQKLNIEKTEKAYVLHVHNAILEIQLETGLLGLTAFILTILLFVKNFLSAYIKSTNKELKLQSLPIFISCITYGVCSMALTSMFHAWWFLYLIALLILLKLSELRLRQ